jgi:hypothetical protein
MTNGAIGMIRLLRRARGAWADHGHRADRAGHKIPVTVPFKRVSRMRWECDASLGARCDGRTA